MGLIKSGIWWWAYLDNEGIIHVKKYAGDHAIRNYEMLPFVKGIFDPFEAFDYEEAKQICYQKYQEVQYFEKKEKQNA